LEDEFSRKKSNRYFWPFPFLTINFNAKAQVPIKNFDGKVFDADQYFEFTTNKKIPKAIQSQAFRALSFYPELKNSHILFRFRKRRPPLSSRPLVISMFKRGGIESTSLP